MYDKDGFGNTEVMKSGRVMEEYVRISGELDALLAKYGYVREGGLYRTGKTEGAAHDATIVLFCHMGVTLFLCSHLLGISPVVLTSGFLPGACLSHGACFRGTLSRNGIFPLSDGGGYQPSEGRRGTGFGNGVFYGAVPGITGMGAMQRERVRCFKVWHINKKQFAALKFGVSIKKSIDNSLCLCII